MADTADSVAFGIAELLRGALLAILVRHVRGKRRV